MQMILSYFLQEEKLVLMTQTNIITSTGHLPFTKLLQLHPHLLIFTFWSVRAEKWCWAAAAWPLPQTQPLACSPLPPLALLCSRVVIVIWRMSRWGRSHSAVAALWFALCLCTALWMVQSERGWGMCSGSDLTERAWLIMMDSCSVFRGHYLETTNGEAGGIPH